MWCRHASYALRHGVNTRKQQILAEVSGDRCEVVLRGVISSKESRLLTWQTSCQERALTEKPGTYGPFSLGPGQRVSIGRVTTPRVLPALNGVKRCHSAQGVIDLTTPPILVCVRAQVSPGSIQQ